MDINSLISQLQSLGPWGWIAAGIVLAITGFQKLRAKPATPVQAGPVYAAAVTDRSAADVLAEQHAQVLAAAAAERKRLQADTAKLAGVGIPPAS